MLGYGDEATADHPNVSTRSKNHGQQISQKDPRATETGSTTPQPTQSDEVTSIPNLDTHHLYQQPAAPTAVMFVPIEHEKQSGTRPVQDLEGSAANIVAEGEDTTTEGLRSMLDGERKVREQAEQRASGERKMRKQAKKDAKSRVHDLEQAEQKAKARIHELEKSGQKDKDRIRELEEKLKLQEASSGSGKDQTK
jgi:hypothetical protein